MIQLFFSFTPVYAVAITILLATVLSGAKRWIALYSVPILPGVLFMTTGDLLLSNGNLLAAAIFAFYLVALFAYYPALVIVSLIVLWRNKAKRNLEEASVPIVQGTFSGTAPENFQNLK